MRADPERWKRTLAQQREGYARRQADPEYAERQRQKQQRYYDESGGREKHARWRARARWRRHLAGFLVLALRVELARREEIARAERERRREVRRAWIARRREAWERGEVDDVEPVWRGNGEDAELRRLPAAPLVAWMKREGFSAEALAEQVGVNPRSMRRYTSGESLTIDIEVIDAIVTNTDALLFEIYEPGRFPGIYEVPVDGPASNLELEEAV